MKKLILLLFLAFETLGLIHPLNVKAQNTGTFKCAVGHQSCFVGTNSCAPGYQPNQTYCTSHNTSADDCQNAPEAACVPIQQGADSCEITANVGSSTDPNKPFLINTLINTGALDKTASYSLEISSGDGLALASYSVTTFNATGEIIQRSFDLSGNEGDRVNIGVLKIGTLGFLIPICDTQITLHKTPEANNYNNLPPVPGVGGVSGKCPNTSYIDTAVGCIRINNIINLTQDILARAVTFAGGISFLFILAGAFQLLTSHGIPEKITTGKEYITSAIGGLVMIIFAIFVLRLIGVDILGVIPR